MKNPDGTINHYNVQQNVMALMVSLLLIKIYIDKAEEEAQRVKEGTVEPTETVVVEGKSWYILYFLVMLTL